ncbi:MAG: hypothetical protein A2V93_08120 [Ignavibacteria bacterium RBG_16_34_14]|nr:MAG: hypothetical protein A2V93_08120 [Ignavibacteria bacterium RBG_16_34_14]
MTGFFFRKILFSLLTIIFFQVTINHLLSAQTISLNGNWQFTIDSNKALTIESIKNCEFRNSVVPLSWQAQFDDLRNYQGVAWYKKSFTLSKIDRGKIVLIKFNAVDYLSEVYINNSSVGKHEGGYTPFEFDITDYINEGLNEIVVRVMDPVNNETMTEGISYLNIPHGKQSWYVETSGIWQDVNIFIKPGLFIKSLKIILSNDGIVEVKIKLNKPDPSNNKIKLIITDGNKKIVLNKKVNISKNETEIQITEKINNPQLWSFDSPYLYEVEAEINGDKIIERFGFRLIEAKNKKLYLNGEPFYLIAALDQDFYPETIYTTPSEEYIRNEMLKAKQLGLNMLRCHIKVPDPVYLKVADEVGLLVWYEIPNWDVFSLEVAARGSKTIDEMLERDWNHPSLVIISIINESWGINLQKKEERSWLLNEFGRVKEKATGRLVVDNSPCYGNFHLKSDINDYHTYWSIPDNKKNFDKTIKEFSQRPKWLFSEFGDSRETGNEPLLISEFGNWGLPKLSEQLPWWIERQFIDIDVSLPKDFIKRFSDYKYDEIFNSYNDLAEESQLAQFTALKYEIETIRMNTEIQGYVITEFTDLNWECNGLLDMWRNFKIYSDDLPLIQQQDVIIPRPVKYNYLVSEEAEIELFISHFSNKNFKNTKLKWKISNGKSGIINVPEIKRGDVIQIQSLKFKLPYKSISAKEKIEFELVEDGKILSKNFIELFIYPDNKILSKEIKFHPKYSLNDFADQLKENYVINDSSTLIVSNLVDDEILSLISNGSNLICLADSNTVLPDSFPIKLLSRTTEWYDGNWASNLNWMRSESEVFQNISFSKSFGFETTQTSPEWVITGIPKANFSDVLAGMFVGWLHLNSGYIVQMQYNKGRIIFCTFPIAKNYSNDPFAKILFNNLINYISTKSYKSTLNWQVN